LQVVRGLPANPTAGPVLDLAGLSGALQALALDAAAREAVLALANGGRGSLVRIGLPEDGEAGELRGVEPRFLGVFDSPSAVALLRQDRDLLVTDAGSNQLFRIRDFAGEAAMEALASGRDGVAGPVGIEVSADGRRVFVANAAERGSVLVMDLETLAVELRATPEGAPNRLDRLHGRNTFLLNEPGESPLMVLDNAENLEVYFVPAGRDN
jgi:DNA-binding beta-propeller fold protein YncE